MKGCKLKQCTVAVTCGFVLRQRALQLLAPSPEHDESPLSGEK